MNGQNDVDLKLLVESRNRLPSTPAQIPEIEEIMISAWIDIMEPLTCSPHEVKNVSFQYRSGVPAAHAFGIAWFLTEDDAIANENQLTTGIPRTRIFPHIPLPVGPQDGAQILEGYVRLFAPTVMHGTVYYGSITIFQV